MGSYLKWEDGKIAVKKELEEKNVFLVKSSGSSSACRLISDPVERDITVIGDQ